MIRAEALEHTACVLFVVDGLPEATDIPTVTRATKGRVIRYECSQIEVGEDGVETSVLTESHSQHDFDCGVLEALSDG